MQVDPVGAWSARGSILFIRGGADVMETVYREQGVGYWSAAFDQVLKHRGWVDMESAEPDVLEHPDRLRRHDIVIVAWLPDWRTEWLHSLRAYDGIIVLEGPLPPLLENFAGVQAAQGAEPLARARVRIRRWLRDSLAPNGQTLPEPLVLEVEPPSSVSSQASDDALIAVLADGYAQVYVNRLEHRAAVFETDPHNDGLAALVLARYCTHMRPGAARDRLLTALAEALAGQLAVRTSGRRAARQRGAAGEAARYAALALTGALANDPVARERAAEWAARIPRRPPRGGAQAQRLSALRAYAASLVGDDRTARFLVRAALSDNAAEADALALLLGEMTCEALGTSDRAAEPAWVNGIKSELRTSGGGALPPTLNGWHVADLFPLAATLRRRGAVTAANAILDHVLAASVDHLSNRVWNGVVVDGCVRATSIRALAPVAALGLLESLAPDHILPADHAGSRLPPTVDPDVAAKSPLRLVPFETIAGEDQVTLEVSGREWAGLTRRGRVLSVSFPLLGQLVHSRALRDARASHTVDALLEDALFLLIEDQLAYYQRAALRVCDRRSDSAAASATLPERPVLRRRGIIETEPAEELDRPAALELRKLADERQGCVFELFSQQRIDDLELWFAWPVALVQGADTDGGKLEVTRVQAPSEGVRIRLGLPPNQPRRLRILRSRSGRYEELAAMVDASGDRAPTEYMPDELLPRVSGLIEVVNRFTPFSSLAGTSVAHMYCGYGPFPLAVHLVERPRRLIGIDRQAESVEVAAWLAEELGAHGIVFRLAQLDQLGPLNDSVDLMLAVDLDLHHVPGSRPQQAVARSFFDALRPGGAIVAEFRSFAPIELRKAFRRAGFGPVRVIDCDLLAPIGRPRGYRKPRFYLAAVKLVA